MTQTSTLDALPKSFVSAMRTLFDVMDDQRTGYIQLEDIERRWGAPAPPGDAGGVPSGVVDSLRKVTPPSGLLSFERFCAGLRIALLRDGRARQPVGGRGAKAAGILRPASVPLPDRENQGLVPQPPRKLGTPVPMKPLRPSNSAERLHHLHPQQAAAAHRLSRLSAAVRPNNVGPASLSQQRAISMPHLVKGGARPPAGAKEGAKRGAGPEPMDREKVSVALEKWRMMKTYHWSSPGGKAPHQDDQGQGSLINGRTPVRGSSSYPNLWSEGVSSSDDSGVGIHLQDKGPAAKKASRRREPRRHTVSNGIDYNMIKRLKLLEQEKDFLVQGLDVVERARKWYMQQIGNINDKLERVSKWDTPHSEYSMDAHHERLNFQMTRISEVNQHLNALMETSEKGFPIHMNLAVQQRNIYDEQRTANQTIQRLKTQNHALTEEIGKKGELITQLESEKSALIRELFHARTYPKKEPNDTTLW